MMRKGKTKRFGLILLCLMIVCAVVPFASASAATDFSVNSDNAYTWLKNMQDSLNGTGNQGLVDSFEDLWDGQPVKTVYTYDQGVATIAFLLRGDKARAKRVLDALKAKQAPDGSWVNSYYVDGSGGELRKHVGVIMWVVMGVIAWEKLLPADDPDRLLYHDMAVKAIDFSLQYQKTGTHGGISGGVTTWDVPGAWTPEVWTSTEHNEDAYNVLLYFAGTTPAKSSVYTSAAANVKRFLDNSVWNDTLKRWNGGWKDNTGQIDPFVPMDINPWGVLSLGLTGTRDYQQSLNYIEMVNGSPGTLEHPKYVQTMSGYGVTQTLYDFDWEDDGATAYLPDGVTPNGTKGQDIWYEGSAFMADAYYMKGNVAKGDAIIGEIVKIQGKKGPNGSTTGTLGGVPYSLAGTNNNYWKMEYNNSVSSTGWLIIAIARYNPFTGTFIQTGPADTQAPTVPAGLASPSHTDTTVSLVWTASTDNTGVTGYDVYRGATKVGSTATTSYTDTGLTGGTAYSYTVKAKDAAGNASAASSPVSVTTSAPVPDTQAPTAPTGLAASTTTASSVGLTWNASTDNKGVTGYDVYRNGTLIGSAAGTSYTASGLTAETTYSFTVKAKDAAGNVSPASAALGVTTSAAVTGDFADKVTYINSSSAKWTFTPNPSASQVILHYSATGIGQQNVPMTANGGKFEYTATGLSSGLKVDYFYTYTLTGQGAKDSIHFPYEHNGGTAPATDTQAPTAPAGLASPSHTDTTVGLTWTASTDNTGVTGYDVYRGAAKVGSTASTSYTDTGLTAGTSYSYTVKAKDAAGNVSAASGAVNVTTNAASTGTGSGTGSGSGSGSSDYDSAVAATGASSAKWTFTPHPSATQVILHYTVSGQPQQNVLMVPNGSAFEYTVTGLGSGASVTYSYTYTLTGQGAKDTQTLPAYTQP